MTHRFIELYLLLQVQADDAVVVIDPVTMEVIHLRYNQNQHTSQFPPTPQRPWLLCSAAAPRQPGSPCLLSAVPALDNSLHKETRKPLNSEWQTLSSRWRTLVDLYLLCR